LRSTLSNSAPTIGKTRPSSIWFNSFLTCLIPPGKNQICRSVKWCGLRPLTPVRLGPPCRRPILNATTPSLYARRCTRYDRCAVKSRDLMTTLEVTRRKLGRHRGRPSLKLNECLVGRVAEAPALQATPSRDLLGSRCQLSLS
jgi:hypothetical protein